MSETNTAKCQHEWQTFRQTVSTDNPLYEWGAAYFIVKGCPKCKTKKYIDYKVEKWSPPKPREERNR